MVPDSSQVVPDKVALARILRAGDLVALGLSVDITLEFCTQVLQIRNAFLLTVIGVGALRAAVGTIVDFRRGRRVPRSSELRGLVAAPMAAGWAIYTALELFRHLDPTSSFWEPLGMPAGVRLGIAALLVLVPMALRIRQFRAAATGDLAAPAIVSRSWQDVTAAILMLSSGAAAAALALTAFIPLNWLTAARRGRGLAPAS
jgi:hypothetical protein